MSAIMNANHDGQDEIFSQIILNIKTSNNHPAEVLSKSLGDYTSKVPKYSQIMRDLMTDIFLIQIKLNDTVGAFCAHLFHEGMYHLSHLIYCLGSHEKYIDGFTWGFLRNFVYNQWSHSNSKVLSISQRNVDLLKNVVIGIGFSQREKVAENIHQLIGHVSKDQFKIILNQLKQIPGFSLRNSKDDLIVEMISRPDDGLIDIITLDIITGEHCHGTPDFTIPGTEDMSNVEVGLEFMLHVIPQALKKLHILYQENISNGKITEAEKIYSKAHIIIHFSIRVFSFIEDSSHEYLSKLWNEISTIHSWESISKPIHDAIIHSSNIDEYKNDDQQNVTIHSEGNSNDDNDDDDSSMDF
uniref:Uncharacterized protein n=1 Tax=viral metagenome TaxID=1070528 RepID=A0A6C0BCS8_9ZZZZ